MLSLQISTVPIEDANDLVCMAVHEEHDLIGTPWILYQPGLTLKGLTAVGSQFWTTLIDRRSAIVIEQIRSVDSEWGIFSHNPQAGKQVLTH